MSFKISGKDDKKAGVYKSLYLSENLKNQVEQLAYDNGSNFNKVVVEMIGYCLANMEESQE